VRAKPLRGGGSVPNRTQIVCLHEGRKGRSIDPIFICSLLKRLKPAWIKPWQGNNIVRPVDCGGRKDLIAKMPGELRNCLDMGGNTTLMVWADLDHDMPDGDKLKQEFWAVAHQAGITKEQFEQVIFAFAKDRLENWIEYLLTGKTDESKEGPRQKHGHSVAEAAKALAQRCASGAPEPKLPPSMAWSCQNWRKLVDRMRQ
jgi:hypothetical protein